MNSANVSTVSTSAASGRPKTRGGAILIGVFSCCAVSGLFAAIPWWVGMLLALSSGSAAICYFARIAPFRILGQGMAIWLLCTATLGGLMALQARAMQNKKEEERLLVAQRAQDEAKARREEAQATRAAAADILSEGRVALDHGATLLAAGKYDEVQASLTSTMVQLEKLAALVPPVDGASALRDQVSVVDAEARGFVSAKEACVTALKHAETYWPDVVKYDELLAADAAALRSISGAPLKKYDRDVRRAQAAVEKRRKGIAKKVAGVRAEERRAAATRASCGDKPVLSPWDGELVGAERHVKQDAHDPDIDRCRRLHRPCAHP